MELLVALVIATAALVTGYAIGLGGAVSTLIFLAILFVGVAIRISQPLLERLRP
jgi:NADH:ubiquinone oxidoreductase subunit 3 (subunit A)